jgi:hypothetical protein
MMRKFQTWFTLSYVRVMAQAVNYRLLAAAVRVRTQVKSFGFVVNIAAPGQVSSQYFGFPCHSLHRLLYSHHSPSFGLVH